MALEEFFRAAQIFQGGMQRLAIGNAIGRAQEQVQEINAQQLDEQARVSQLQQVQSNLAFGLGRAGAPASTIGAVGGFAPQQVSPNVKAQIESNEKLATNSQRQQLDIAKLRITEQQFRQQQTRADKLDGRTLEQANKFRTSFAKSDADSVTAGLGGLELVEQAKLTGQPATLRLLRIALIRGAGDARPSNLDVESVAPNPSIANQAKRWLFERGFNHALPEDIQVQETILKSGLKAARRRLRKQVTDFSFRGARLGGLNQKDFEKELVRDNSFLLGLDTQDNERIVDPRRKQSRFLKKNFLNAFTPD